MLETIKKLLGISGTEQDEILNVLITATTEHAKAYCRLTDIPEAMNAVLAIIVCDAYREGGYGSVDRDAAVSSMTDGKESVSFDTSLIKVAIERNIGMLKAFINRRGVLPSELS